MQDFELQLTYVDGSPCELDPGVEAFSSTAGPSLTSDTRMGSESSPRTSQVDGLAQTLVQRPAATRDDEAAATLGLADTIRADVADLREWGIDAASFAGVDRNTRPSTTAHPPSARATWSGVRPSPSPRPSRAMGLRTWLAGLGLALVALLVGVPSFPLAVGDLSEAVASFDLSLDMELLAAHVRVKLSSAASWTSLAVEG